MDTRMVEEWWTCPSVADDHFLGSHTPRLDKDNDTRLQNWMKNDFIQQNDGDCVVTFDYCYQIDYYSAGQLYDVAAGGGAEDGVSSYFWEGPTTACCGNATGWMCDPNSSDCSADLLKGIHKQNGEEQTTLASWVNWANWPKLYKEDGSYVALSDYWATMKNEKQYGSWDRELSGWSLENIRDGDDSGVNPEWATQHDEWDKTFTWFGDHFGEHAGAVSNLSYDAHNRNAYGNDDTSTTFIPMDVLNDIWADPDQSNALDTGNYTNVYDGTVGYYLSGRQANVYYPFQIQKKKKKIGFFSIAFTKSQFFPFLTQNLKNTLGYHL